MTATLRRALRVLLLVTMLGTVGSLVGFSGAAASVRLPADGSATPPVPTSTVSPDPQPDTVTYCVDNYAPNSVVSVANNANGATGTIHTNAAGHGCTHIPVKTDCSQPVSNTIVASGTDQAGKPATSQATYVAPPTCTSGSPTPSPSTEPGGGTPTPTPTETCDKTQATLSVTVVPEGAKISGTACGFLAGEAVDAFAHSTPVYLGTTSAAGDGTVGGAFTLPPSITAGDHIFTFVGRTSGNTASAPFTVTNIVVGSGGGVLPGGGGNGNGSGSGSGGGGGGLAFTGADIAAMVLVGLGLLVAGTLTVVSVRRRRAAPATPGSA